jgi:hypothetical protein
LPKTLSNLTGKWINKISDDEVEFEDGTKINTKDLDYKLMSRSEIQNPDFDGFINH